MADPVRVSFEPVDHDPFADMPGMITRPTGAQQWQSAIEDQRQRDLRKSSMGQQIGNIVGTTAEILASPVLNQAKRMQDVYEHGIDWDDPQRVQELSGETFLDMAGLAGGTAIPRVAGVTGRGNSLGMFFAAPKAAAAEAEKMLASGSGAADIWNKLGVFQGKDGAWRSEITGPSSYQPGKYRLRESKLSDAIDQPHVYERMPRLANVGVTNAKSTGIAADSGYYQPFEVTPRGNYREEHVWLNPTLNRTPSRALETGQHETQHAVQRRYGWPDGTSPDYAGSYEAYHMDAGEVEARNAAKREKIYRDIAGDPNKGPKAAHQWLRDNPPWTTEDVPREQQIVAGQGSGPQLSVGKPPAPAPAGIGPASERPPESLGVMTPIKGGPMLARAAQTRAERIANEVPLQNIEPKPAFSRPTGEDLAAAFEKRAAQESAGNANDLAIDAFQHDQIRNRYAARGKEPPAYLKDAPTGASLKGEARKIYDQMMGIGTRGQESTVAPKPSITAYHGSPHDFDRFDSSAIGTGTGDASYGRGFNFSGAEKEAKGYRDRLSDDGEGHLYQVSIKADPADFAHWDKPLKEQPKAVQDALRPVVNRLLKDDQARGHLGSSNSPDEQLMGHIFDAAKRSSAGRIAVEKVLQDAGVPGVKYEGGTEGSHNYVVFDDKLIDILKKYGIAGIGALPAMGAYHFQTNQVDHDPFAR